MEKKIDPMEYIDPLTFCQVKFDSICEVIEELCPKIFEEHSEKLSNKIYRKLEGINYYEETMNFLAGGFHGMEIISHPRLCYLRDEYGNICRKIFDGLVNCGMVRDDSQENFHDFLIGNSENSDLILIPRTDGIGGKPMTSFSLILTRKYFDLITKDRKSVLVIDKKLPEKVHFLLSEY